MKSILTKSLVIATLAMLTISSLGAAATPPALLSQLTVPYGCGGGSMVKPDAATFDPLLGRVYFLDRCSWVNCYDTTGVWVNAWDAGAGSCSGITVDDSSNVYVVDGSGHQIKKFSSEGQLAKTWLTTSVWPSDIAFIPVERRLIVAEYPARIEAFSTMGALVATVATGGVTPYGVGVDLQTREFYVTYYDGAQAFVRKFAADGSSAGQLGSYGTEAGQFLQPLDVAVSADHTVYVTDGTGRRVVSFDQAGQPVAKWGDSTMFNQTGGITVDSDGRIWVASHDRIGMYSMINIFGDAATPVINKSWGAVKVIYR